MDWVLAQKSLKRLHLDQCTIPTYIRLYSENVEEWGISTDGWQKFAADVADDEYEDASLVYYVYPGTWSFFLDKIKNELPNLTDFKLLFDENQRFASLEDGYAFWTRYNHFDYGLLPSRWIAHHRNPTHISDELLPNWQGLAREERRHIETESTDSAALDALLKAVNSRRIRSQG